MSVLQQNNTATVRIGCAAGFWGDTNTAAFQLVKTAQIDYLVFDYLAEVTMSILAKAKQKDPNLGYATDFITRVMQPLMYDISDKNIKVISNAGGINPLACRDALVALIDGAGLKLKVAVVLGDDLTDKQAHYRTINTTEMFTGDLMPSQLASMNAYVGAVGICEALDAGADIVITGRVVDSAVTIGALLHEFRWELDDYNRIAAAALAGHIIECGAQCTGGNFTDWESVPDYDNMGFPIVEVASDGSFTVQKPANTGGLISIATVAEQVVYEIGDPQSYLLPDVTADFSQVQLTQLADNVVHVTGALGRAPTNSYKVSATYMDGYRVNVSFMMAGIDVKRKAERVSQAILSKCSRVLTMRGAPPFSATSVEIIGTECTYGAHQQTISPREVAVKIAVTHPIKEACMFFASEIAQASTGMAPGLAGLLGGRPKVSPVIKLFSCLVPKQDVQVVVDFAGALKQVEIPITNSLPIAPLTAGEEAVLMGDEMTVPLIKLAWARSGDKGNSSNIGVIARKPEFLPYIRAALTCSSVASYMAHVLDKDKSVVTRYELPALHALNFLLTHALGGGGMASLRIDAQGKAFAQQVLEMPVLIPARLLV